MQLFNILCLLLATGCLGIAVKRSEGAQLYGWLGALFVVFDFLITALIGYHA